MQPQGHLQVLSNMIDFDMTPQEALDCFRFRVSGAHSGGCNDDDDTVYLEDGVPEDTLDGLRKKGHRVTLLEGWDRMTFGRGQIIRRSSSGVLSAGSDPRADGHAAAI